MKKSLTLLLVPILLLGECAILGNQFAYANNDIEKKLSSHLNNDPTSQSLNRLKEQGAVFIPKKTNPELFNKKFKTENIFDNDNSVTPTVGTGIDSDNNITQLDINKGLNQPLYYLDNTQNKDRISVMNFPEDSLLIYYLMLVAHQRISTYKDNRTVSSMDSCFNTEDQRGAVTAADQFQKCRDFYLKNFQYEGFDDNKTKLENNVIATHVVQDDALLGNMTFNAANLYLPGGSSSLTLFGEGGTIKKSETQIYTADNFDKDRPSIAHEYSHGVITSIVNFTNLKDTEQGGLSEGLADVFSAAITGNWEMAGAITNVAEDGSSFRRNLKNPAIYKMPGTDRHYPSKYSDLSIGIDGHYSGSIIGHQFSLLANGGEFNGTQVSGIGTEKAIRIIFNSLSELPDGPSFKNYRSALEYNTAREYGFGSNEFKSMVSSLNATEIPN